LIPNVEEPFSPEESWNGTDNQLKRAVETVQASGAQNARFGGRFRRQP
jgi:hypothetical protein